MKPWRVKMRRLLLAASISLGLASLGFGVAVSALDMSPQHFRLAGILKKVNSSARQAATSLAATSSSGFETVEAVEVVKEQGGETAGRKVYRQPTEPEKQLLLSSLAEKIRTMPAGDLAGDQAVLASYFKLKNGSGSSQLASADSVAGELYVPQDAVVEVEPNDDWQAAQQLVLGDTLKGGAVPYSEVDIYKFHAEKGQYVHVQALPLVTSIYEMGYVIVRLLHRTARRYRAVITPCTRMMGVSSQRMSPTGWFGRAVIWLRPAWK